jgi:hypothetical protein
METMEEKVKEAISVMKKAYDTYNTNAQKNIDIDDSMYWYWSGIAEGTRRSWELLEELFNIKEDI